MSWAAERRALYFFGVALFLILLISIPIVIKLYEPDTCFDKKQNQGETAPDKGGPCNALDERALAPVSILWSRSFKIRDGFYTSVAYAQNSNDNAGIRSLKYKFGLYDSKNVLIAEREGTTFIMPAGITPIFESGIDTGNREVAHTYIEFTEMPLWERVNDPAAVITLNNKEITNIANAPRLEASVTNTSVAPLSDISVVAVIFTTSGNAFAASRTTLSNLLAGEKKPIIFTWPEGFEFRVGRIDIFPLIMPRVQKR